MSTKCNTVFTQSHVSSLLKAGKTVNAALDIKVARRGENGLQGLNLYP